MSLRNGLRLWDLPALSFACLLPWPAITQDYPTRSLKMIVPYPAGGSVDQSGRAFAERRQAALGQSIVAELAYQRWEGEWIAEETFFYDPSQRTPIKPTP